MSQRRDERATAPSFSEVEVVSFDLFETLIVRPFERPEDAFELLTPLARSLTNGALHDFPKVRREAKHWAEHRVGEEVPLEARYRAIELRLGISPAASASLMAAELDLELRSARPNPVAKGWFDDAIAQGKLVCIVSDTYYARPFIESLLAAADYRGWHRLYVSSETGLLKSSGRMFQRLLDDLGVPAARVLHVGDDPVSDSRRATEAGLRTWPRPAPRELFARHARAALVLPQNTLHERAVRGLVARRFACAWEEGQPPSFVGASAEQLGYSLLGPLLHGFSTWLCGELLRRRCDAVFFLARDGRVMKQAYDLLRLQSPSLPPATYLWASRRGTLLPAARTASDLARLLELPGSTQPLAELLARRFALTRTDLAGVTAAEFGFRDWDETVHPERDRERLERVLKSLAPLILERATEERAALLDYYDAQGLRSAQRPALVDLGHQGTLQLALSTLIGRNDFEGLYFATVQAIDRVPAGRAKSYVGAASDAPATLGAYEPRLQMFELLFPGDEGSFVRMTRDGESFRAETLVSAEDEARQRFVRAIHRGALEFLRDLADLLGEQSLASGTAPEAALLPYLAFLSDPSEADVQCFSGVRVENAFSGRPSVEVLAAQSGIWPEASRASGRADGRRSYRRRLIRAIREISFSNRRLRKVLRDPRAFFSESRFGALRWLGRRW